MTGNVTNYNITITLLIRTSGKITAEYSVDGNNNRVLRYRYTYDEAEQLVRVNDNVSGKTTVYQYDKGGNRVSCKEYENTDAGSVCYSILLFS